MHIVYNMAEVCFTSTATISRLIQQLGFRNYTNFNYDYQ